jgi:murein DD-endopeptidase MepM/ murein hydrolase activator NlpD
MQIDPKLKESAYNLAKKVGEGMKDGATWLAPHIRSGAEGLGSLVRESAVKIAPHAQNGVVRLATMTRDGTARFGPYVVPNLAVLAAMNSGVEGFDYVLDLSETTEMGAFATGAAALGYINYRASQTTSDVKNQLSNAWAQLGSNLKAGLVTGTAVAMLAMPGATGAMNGLYERVTGVSSQVVQIAPSFRPGSELSDEDLIQRYGRFRSPTAEDRKSVLKGLKINDKYGVYRSGNRTHKGLDVKCEVGDELYPIGAGRVTEVMDYAGKRLKSNGKTVRYKLADGTEVTNLHLSRFKSGLEAGDVVGLDTVIGYCGHTGNASADNVHVHLQIDNRVGSGGKVIDPTAYFKGNKDGRLQSQIRAKPDVYLPFLREVAQKEGYMVSGE